MNQAAAWLLELGVEPGEHVGIWSMNVPEWIVTQFAVGQDRRGPRQRQSRLPGS